MKTIVTLIVILSLFAVASAEWVGFAPFEGYLEDVSDLAKPPTAAEEMRNFVIEYGELVPWMHDSLNLTSPPIGACRAFIAVGQSDRLLVDKGVLAVYIPSVDTTFTLSGDSLFACDLYAGDTAIRRVDEDDPRDGADTTGSVWAKYLGTNLRFMQTAGAVHNVRVYDDTLMRAFTPIIESGGNDTTVVPMYPPFWTVALGTGQSPDAIQVGDTTWIVDGAQLTTYVGDTATSPGIVEPEPAWFGQVDSLTVAAGPVVSGTGSIRAWGDFTDTLDGWVGAYRPESFAWITSDTGDGTRDMYRNNGMPFGVYSHENDGAADEYLVLVGDTCRAPTDTDDSPFGEGSRMTVWKYDKIEESGGYETWTLTGDYDYVGGNRGRFKLDDDDWIDGNVRIWDNRLVRIRYRSSVLYVSRLEKDGSDYYLWAWDSYGNAYLADVSDISFYADVYEGVAVQTDIYLSSNEYQIIELHRGRAYYARSTQGADRFTFSFPFHYDSIYTDYQTIAPDDDITCLKSYGEMLVIFLRNSIVVQYGSALADFYYVPVSKNVGAVSNNSVVLNPLTNTLFFLSEKGLFEFDGSAVREVPTQNDALLKDQYWGDASAMQAAIYDNKYWFTRLVGLQSRELWYVDLETGSVGEFRLQKGTTVPRSLTVYEDRAGAEPRLFAGGKNTVTDKMVMMEVGTESTALHDYWYRLSAPVKAPRGQLIAATEYAVTVDGSYIATPAEGIQTDTLIVAIVCDGTLKQTDRIFIDVLSGEQKTFRRWCGMDVYGEQIKVALSTKSMNVRVVDMKMNIAPVGRTWER